MTRTGHSSSDGVRYYKHVTDNLCEKTSSVLNGNSVVKSDSKPSELEVMEKERESTLKEKQSESKLQPRTELPSNSQVLFHFLGPLTS